MEVCIFCLCVLFLLQVAAVYRDPSVGNLINIMIVKLIVVHNEQVSAGVATCVRLRWMSWQVFLAWTFFPLLRLFERTVAALSVKERSPWKTRGFTERHLEYWMKRLFVLFLWQLIIKRRQSSYFVHVFHVKLKPSKEQYLHVKKRQFQLCNHETM